MRWLLAWLSILILSNGLAYAGSAAVFGHSSPLAGDEESIGDVYQAGTCQPVFGSYGAWLYDVERRGRCVAAARAAGEDGVQDGSGCLSRVGAGNAWLYTNSPRGVCEHTMSTAPSSTPPP